MTYGFPFLMLKQLLREGFLIMTPNKAHIVESVKNQTGITNNKSSIIVGTLIAIQKSLIIGFQLTITNDPIE